MRRVWLAVILVSALFALAFHTDFTSSFRPGLNHSHEESDSRLVTRATNTRLERAFREFRYGMTEKEVCAVVDKYTREKIPDSDGLWIFAEKKAYDTHLYGPDHPYPDGGIPLRYVEWEGEASGSCNWPIHTIYPTSIHARFHNDKLYQATYECWCEAHFATLDLMLLEDGLHPYNYAIPEK